MAILTTDQDVFNFVKLAISLNGRKVEKGLLEDALDNPCDPPEDRAWGQALTAIRKNQVENIGFGKEVMLNVGRKWLGLVGNESTQVDQYELVLDLEYELRQARDRVIAHFTGPLP